MEAVCRPLPPASSRIPASRLGWRRRCTSAFVRSPSLGRATHSSRSWVAAATIGTWTARAWQVPISSSSAPPSAGPRRWRPISRAIPRWGSARARRRTTSQTTCERDWPRSAGSALPRSPSTCGSSPMFSPFRDAVRRRFGTSTRRRLLGQPEVLQGRPDNRDAPKPDRHIVLAPLGVRLQGTRARERLPVRPGA